METNTHNTAGAPGAGTNPSKCYCVCIGRTDYRQWTAYVIAETEDQAEQAAMRLAEIQPDEAWQNADYDLLILDVREVKGGPGHE